MSNYRKFHRALAALATCVALAVVVAPASALQYPYPSPQPKLLPNLVPGQVLIGASAISIQVVNSGAATAPASYTDMKMLTSAGWVVRRVWTPSILAGGAVWVSVSRPAGFNTINCYGRLMFPYTVTVDAAGAIAESNEFDNTFANLCIG